MSTYLEETATDAIRLFESASYPQGLNATSAWLGIYQVLLWYESVEAGKYTSLPHIIDADKLRPSVRRRNQAKSSPQPNAWQKRAEAVENHLAEHLRCPAHEVRSCMDQLMRHPNYDGLQRQNPLGTAFIAVVKHVLESFGDPRIHFQMEVLANTIFPGISLPGRSETPSVDIFAFKGEHPRAIIST